MCKFSFIPQRIYKKRSTYHKTNDLEFHLKFVQILIFLYKFSKNVKRFFRKLPDVFSHRGGISQ